MGLGGLDKIAEALSLFSTMAVSLTTIIGLLSLMFKPIRKIIICIYRHTTGGKDKNKEILDKIDGVSQKVDDVRDDLTKKIKDVSDSNDRNEIKRLRWEILDFANSCKNGRRHTQDEFKHIIEAHDDYEKLLLESGGKNGFLDAEFDYVLRQYAERQEKNDFL